MSKSKLVICGLMAFNALASVNLNKVHAATSAPALNIQSCSIQNGSLGDSNPQLRDFCLSQSNDVSSGKAQDALGYAMSYYNALACTSATLTSNGNCQKAANIIASGTVLAFHLDFTTLSKIRDAVPVGSSNGCSCPA